MTRTRKPSTAIKDGAIRRAANALRKAGNESEARRLERNLPAEAEK